MNTPTPGAASELLPQLLAYAEHRQVCDYAHSLKCDCGLWALQLELAKPGYAITRTPAPVMEGAQREAVERDNYWRMKLAEVCNAIGMDPYAWNKTDPYTTNEIVQHIMREFPPPPDRVQPERGDGQPSVNDISDADLVLRAVCNAAHGRPSRQVRWAHVAEAFALGSTFASQLCRRFDKDPDELIGHFPDEDNEEAAPPTDASGGVTEDALTADFHALRERIDLRFSSGNSMAVERASVTIDEWMRLRSLATKGSRIEAADRARKPVDASAQAADSLAVVERIIAMWHEKYPQADAIDINWLRSAGIVLLPTRAQAASAEPALHCPNCGATDGEGCGACPSVSVAQPVALVDGVDLGFLRDFLADRGGVPMTELSLTQELPCMVPLYTDPTPVAAYREVTLSDAGALIVAIAKSDGPSGSHIMLAALRSIGAVIRTDGQKAQP